MESETTERRQKNTLSLENEHKSKLFSYRLLTPFVAKHNLS
jgi:hypothetical protein